MSTKLET